jgi:bifunctional non-homologous end joining protein LigD
MPTAREQLKTYQSKRNFAKTAEPSGKISRKRKSKGLSFVVQKHDASRLHYDFRLELDGVLKSWAVTKGPSTNPADKRLAVHVEDHPLDYGGFEGTIPEGEYGGGTVMLWDQGTWEPIGDPHEGLKKGDLKFRLSGKRMKGEWVLVHMKGRDAKTRSGTRENWLLIKHRDKYATDADGLTEKFTTSVDTGRDLDGIARGLKSRKKAATASAPVKVWTRKGEQTLPDFRPPQLATLVTEIPEGDDWLFEMKYDGYRALAAIAGDQVRLYTRNANDWTRQFAPLVEPLSRLTKGAVLLDGEVVAFKDGRTDFSTLKDALSSGAELSYFVFDLLEQDGEDLHRLPLAERKTRLAKLIGKRSPSDPIQFSEHIAGRGRQFFEAMCKGGYEGMIAKLADAPYRGERSKSWLKIKCGQRQEFVIGGWRPSDRKKTFASLLLGSWDGGKLVYHGRVGTGWNLKDAAALQKSLDARSRKTNPFANAPRDVARHAKWVTPDLVAEIGFTEFTPDVIVRHPSFLGIRRDKAAKEVTLELPKDAPVAARPASRSGAKWSKAMKPPVFTDDMGIAAAERLGVKLTHPEKIVYPEGSITKAQLVAYYDAVSEPMLRHVAERPLSLVRRPTGSSKPFFQKHDSGGFPDAFKKVKITETTGPTDIYLYIDDAAGLAASVQMSALELHIWGSHIDKLEHADRIIFDIDPDEGLDFRTTRQAARDIRDRLGKWGLESFPMVTGGKGIHVIAPLRRTLEWPEVKLFCRTFAERLAADEPDRFTANIRKASRKGRMFVDYLRNERGSTAVSPYSTRAKPGCPVATPVSWDEVETLEAANAFSLGEAAARAQGPDPWPDYFKLTQSITKAMLSSVAGDKL